MLPHWLQYFVLKNSGFLFTPELVAMADIGKPAAFWMQTQFYHMKTTEVKKQILGFDKLNAILN